MARSYNTLIGRKQKPTDNAPQIPLTIDHSPFTSYQLTPYRKACTADIMLAQEIESLKQGACRGDFRGWSWPIVVWLVGP